MGRVVAIGLVLTMVLAVGCESGGASSPFERFRGSARADYATSLNLPQASTETLDPQADLATLQTYAALHNPGLEAAFNEWKASLEEIAQARSLPDPRFSYRYYVSEVETRVGAMRQGVSVSQTFPWIEKLQLRGDAAADAARASQHRFRQKRWQLSREVADAWWEYYYLHRSLAVYGENMRLLEQMEQIARIRYKASAGSHPDVVRAQVALGTLADRLDGLRALLPAVAAKLNATLNRPANAALPAPNTSEQPAVALDSESLQRWLAEGNPKLAAMDAEVDRSRRQVALARQAYLPDLTLGVDYVEINDSTGGRHPSDDGKDAVAIMASINVPIWYDKLSAGVRQARHRAYAAMLKRQQQANELTADLKMASYRYTDANRRMGLYRKTLLPKAQQLVKTSEASFRAGQASFLDVLDAQRALLEFDLAADRAQADRGKALAELQALVGRLLSETSASDDEESGTR